MCARSRTSTVSSDELRTTISRAAVVRILVGGERTLTARFAALASHYLFEPCFCRPGEGHDKGGVESRGKAVRRQTLTPIPHAPTLAAINHAMLAQMDARLDTGRDRTGATIGARFVVEGPPSGRCPRPSSRRQPRSSRSRRRVLSSAQSGGCYQLSPSHAGAIAAPPGAKEAGFRLTRSSAQIQLGCPRNSGPRVDDE